MSLIRNKNYILLGETIRLPCGKEVAGKYVAITIPGVYQILSLCEVQVYGVKGEFNVYFSLSLISSI